MKRILLITAMVLSFSLALFAQEGASQQDYILLNNGTVIYGTIVGDASGTKLTILTAEGDYLTYPKSEINKIMQSNPADNLKKGSGSTYKEYYNMDRGFWFGFDLYGGISTNVNGLNGGLGELDLTVGYRVNEYFKIGAGVGGRYYIKNTNLRLRSTEWSFPIYGTIRGNMLPSYERSVVPYYSISAGYAIRDGFMIRPTIGARFGELKRSSFLLGVSYLGQMLERPITGKDKYQSFITLNLGYEF